MTSRRLRSPDRLDLSDEVLGPLYLSMLQLGSATRATLEAQGFAAEELDELLPVLVERRMIQPVSPDAWAVVPPDIAIPAYASQLEARARVLRDSAPVLSRVHSAGNSADPRDVSEGVVVLESLADMVQALHRITAGAQEWVLSSRTDSPLSRQLVSVPEAVSAGPAIGSLGEPLSVRVNVDAALLPDENVLKLMQLRVEAGAEVRLATTIPFTGAVNDQGMALVDLGNPEGPPVGVLLTARTGAARVRAAMEMVWRIGVTWRPAEHPASAGDPLDQRDRSIIRLMAAGAPDAAIARQLGISSRTVERRVRALIDRLNASTRFQAAVLAARRGLV